LVWKYKVELAKSRLGIQGGPFKARYRHSQVHGVRIKSGITKGILLRLTQSILYLSLTYL